MLQKGLPSLQVSSWSTYLNLKIIEHVDQNLGLRSEVIAVFLANLPTIDDTYKAEYQSN